MLWHHGRSWQKCQHRADTFVLVFRIVNTSGHTGFPSTTGLLWLLFGWLLVWVVFLPLLNHKPMVENNSGALQCIPCANAHEYLCVHLVHNSSSVALQLHGGASHPAGGSAIHVDNTQKAVEWQAWLMQHLASSGDLLSVPSGGCMLLRACIIVSTLR